MKSMSVAGAAALLALVAATGDSGAASHREAPLMALDPAADISDVYAFVSYDDANLARAAADRRVTLIMNVLPGQEPSSGPNYFAFDDTVLYAIHLDLNRDGVDDLSYEFRFTTQTVSPDQFIATLALPPVTALEGPGSEGLSRKQRYTVTEVRHCGAARSSCETRTTLFQGQVLSAVPSNIGPRTTPDYETLATTHGIFTDPGQGLRVFAGQRAETFAIDLGAVFDTLNLRTETPPPPGGRALPVLSVEEDADDAHNAFGSNSFSGFNVNTIALEVPIRRITRDGQAAGPGNGLVGVYASTSRQSPTILQTILKKTQSVKTEVPWKQVSRMGNPLVNELIIPVGRKDEWNGVAPEDEAQFLPYYRGLAIASALQLVSGVPVPPAPREDIVGLLTKYAGQNPDPGIGPFSELLRLDLTVPPTPPEGIHRLGPLAHDATGSPTPDAAGFPNGRRPNDDVTDLGVRVAGGPNYIANRVGDGVNVNEKGITPYFPFLPEPFDGRNRQHKDPGEPTP